jgi:signal peptidase I
LGAAALSLALPGLGHLYAGSIRQAIWAVGLVVLSILLSTIGALFVPGPWNLFLVWLGPALWALAIPIHAAITAARAPKPFALQPFNRWYIYLLFALSGRGIGVMILAALRLYVVGAFRIPSGAMEPTLLVGDFIYVDKTARARDHLEPGDLAVFTSTEEPISVIKRVIGVPGDTLAMRDGQILRNGAPLEERYTLLTDPEKSEDDVQRAKMRAWQLEYLAGDSTSYAPDLHDWGPIVVPASGYFMMGDNRDASYDSRYYGLIPAENILGRPTMVYYSYDRTGYRPFPWLTAIRWNRLGDGLQ